MNNLEKELEELRERLAAKNKILADMGLKNNREITGLEVLVNQLAKANADNSATK